MAEDSSLNAMLSSFLAGHTGLSTSSPENLQAHPQAAVIGEALSALGGGGRGGLLSKAAKASPAAKALMIGGGAGAGAMLGGSAEAEAASRAKKGKADTSGGAPAAPAGPLPAASASAAPAIQDEHSALYAQKLDQLQSANADIERQRHSNRNGAAHPLMDAAMKDRDFLAKEIADIDAARLGKTKAAHDEEVGSQRAADQRHMGLTGAGLGLGAGAVMTMLGGGKALRRSAQFNTLAKTVDELGASTKGNIVGTAKGDQMRALINQAHELGGVEAPLGLERMGATMPGSRDALERGYAQKYQGTLSGPMTEDRVARDMAKRPKAIHAEEGRAAADAIERQRAPFAAKEQSPFSSVKPEGGGKSPSSITSHMPGDLTIPASIALEGGFAGWGYPALTGEKNEDTVSGLRSAAMGSLGAAGGYMLGRKLTKGLPMPKGKPDMIAKVQAGRERFERDLSAFSPKAATAAVDKQTGGGLALEAAAKKLFGPKLPTGAVGLDSAGLAKASAAHVSLVAGSHEHPTVQKAVALTTGADGVVDRKALGKVLRASGGKLDGVNVTPALVNKLATHAEAHAAASRVGPIF